MLGSECKPTFDAMLIRRNEKKGSWRTVFRADEFKRADGTKVTKKELEELLYTKGDGIVTQRSFLTSSLPGAKLRNNNYRTALPARDVTFTCEIHNQLLSNQDVQNKLFVDLVSKN